MFAHAFCAQLLTLHAILTLTHSIFRLCALQAVTSAAVEAPAAVTEADVVIIGSGIAGLCCGSLLAKYGYKVHVCESHYHAGGAAHAFEVKVNCAAMIH
jgi:ribulose 1,5-bisphosphate synthetase/thiazole synthase